MAIREEAKVYVPQMGHCSRCRADAVGLVGETTSNEIAELLKRAAVPHVTAERPYVAVASMEGIFVNQHLGEATQLWIFGICDGKTELVERRFAPSQGGGAERWAQMANTLHDCSAVLVSGIGPYPQTALERADVRVVVMEGLASEGVEAILTDREIPRILLRTPGRCGIGKECTGTGMGCG
jgi:nitrogen fixation protein NifB